MEKTKRAATGRDSEKYIVRFPEGMRDRIAALAKTNNRSMNAEIVARLQQSLEQEPRPLAGDSENIDPAFLAEVEKRAAEWGCSKTRALIRMTIEEFSGQSKG